MKRPPPFVALTAIATAAMAFVDGSARAQDSVDDAGANAFDHRLFAGALRKDSFLLRAAATMRTICPSIRSRK